MKAAVMKLADDQMLLFCIGTSHSLQKGLRNAPQGCYAEFQLMVRQAAQHHSVRTIAEEMSEEALGDAVSLCAEVAAELAISHLFCDLNRAEREALGLPVEDCLSTWSGREVEWLNRLKRVTFPVLFVCGAKHVDSFAEKWSARGGTVKVLDGDWAPTKPIPLEYRL